MRRKAARELGNAFGNAGKVALAGIMLHAIAEAQRLLAAQGEVVLSGDLVDLAEQVRLEHGAERIGDPTDIIADTLSWGWEIATLWDQRPR